MLVDTHVLVWMANDNRRLGDRARELIGSRHPVYYSSMSVFEMVIKNMKHGLAVPEEICSHFDQIGLRQMPFIGEHAEALTGFPEIVRHDPFDRALLAQARAEGLTFLTADRRLLSLGHTWIVDAAA